MRTLLPLCTIAIALGQHVRVGIEDNIWGRKGQRLGTVGQVEEMVRIAKVHGREVATGDAARRIMKIGTWYQSVEETLFNLGLPPNRKGGQQGFVVYETDGKLHKAQAAGSDGHPSQGCNSRGSAIWFPCDTQAEPCLTSAGKILPWEGYRYG